MESWQKLTVLIQIINFHHHCPTVDSNVAGSTESAGGGGCLEGRVVRDELHKCACQSHGVFRKLSRLEAKRSTQSSMTTDSNPFRVRACTPMRTSETCLPKPRRVFHKRASQFPFASGRCPPRQKSRVKRLKAKTEPLLT